MTFLPNKYARCACMLSEEFSNISDSNICTFFEDNGEDEDICKECFHGADCHSTAVPVVPSTRSDEA